MLVLKGILAVLLCFAIGALTFVGVGTVLHVLTGSALVAGIVALVATGAAAIATFEWSLNW